MIFFPFWTSGAEDWGNLSYLFMAITIWGPYQIPLFFLSVFSSLSSSPCQFPCYPNKPFVIDYLWTHVKQVGLFCYLLYVQHMAGKVLAQIKDSITGSSFPFFPWKILPAGETTLLTTRPPILDARESFPSVGLAAPERRASCPSGSHSKDNDLERGQAWVFNLQGHSGLLHLWLTMTVTLTVWQFPIQTVPYTDPDPDSSLYRQEIWASLLIVYQGFWVVL